VDECDVTCDQVINVVRKLLTETQFSVFGEHSTVCVKCCSCETKLGCIYQPVVNCFEHVMRLSLISFFRNIQLS